MTFSVETCSITTLIRLFSRPFPSCLVLLVQNGSSCKTFHTETSLIYIKMNLHVGETRLHMNGASRELVLTQRQKPTRKWPICGAFSLVFKFTRKVKYLNLKKLIFPVVELVFYVFPAVACLGNASAFADNRVISYRGFIRKNVVPLD